MEICAQYLVLFFSFSLFVFSSFFIYGILPMLVFCLLFFSSEDLNYYIIVI